MSFRRGIVDFSFSVVEAFGARLVAFLNRRRAAILCYHSIVDWSIPLGMARSGLHLPLTAFRAQMDFLARTCTVVPLSEVLEGTPGPAGRPRVALTFDDGYANNGQLAFPILERLGLPATLFVVADFADSGRAPWWDALQIVLSGAPEGPYIDDVLGRLDFAPPSLPATTRAIRQHCMTSLPEERRRILEALTSRARSVDLPLLDRMRAHTWTELAGLPSVVQIGNHTATHRVLDRINEAEAAWEISEGALAVRRHLGNNRTVPEFLCYPRGESSASVRALAARLHVSLGFGLMKDVGSKPTAGDGSDPLNLPRMVVGPHFTAPRFRLAAAGYSASRA